MQQPQSRSVATAISRAMGPLSCPEYRRLLLTCYMLLARAQMLSLALTVVEPFATPGLLRMIRRWFDRLKADSAEFSRALRARNIRRPAPRPIAPPPPSSGPYRNPWL
jgi:hypothetical protein